MIRTGENEVTNLATKFAKYVRISNFDRTSGTPSDFVVDLSNDFDIRQTKAIFVQSVSLPHTFQNITTNNNVLYLFAERAVPADSILINITIPPGQYTVNQLMTVLKNLIDPFLVATFGVGSSITFTYNALTNRIEYTIVNFDTVQFLYTVGPPTALLYSTIAYNLGFTADTTPSASAAFPSGPSLAGPAMVFLHSQEFNSAGTYISANIPISTFCSIPVRVPYLSLIHYESVGSMLDFINLKSFKSISNVNIKVRAQDGTILQLGENDELIITLKVFY